MSFSLLMVVGERLTRQAGRRSGRPATCHEGAPAPPPCSRLPGGGRYWVAGLGGMFLGLTSAGLGEVLMPGKGHRHEVTKISGSGEMAHTLMPRVHRVASLFKRWWLGTHQGAISADHLDYYLDEFTFRFNRRASGSRGKLFFRLVQQVVSVAPVYWDDVVAARRSRGADEIPT